MAALSNCCWTVAPNPNVSWKGHKPYALARMYGNTSFAVALERARHGTPLTASESALATCADGSSPANKVLSRPDLGNEERRLLTRIILWEDRLKHARALVAGGLNANVTEEMDMSPSHLASLGGAV